MSGFSIARSLRNNGAKEPAEKRVSSCTQASQNLVVLDEKPKKSIRRVELFGNGTRHQEVSVLRVHWILKSGKGFDDRCTCVRIDKPSASLRYRNTVLAFSSRGSRGRPQRNVVFFNETDRGLSFFKWNRGHGAVLSTSQICQIRNSSESNDCADRFRDPHSEELRRVAIPRSSIIMQVWQRIDFVH